MHLREWLWLALFAVVLWVALAWARRRRRPVAGPVRPGTGMLMGLLVGLAAVSAGCSGREAAAAGGQGAGADAAGPVRLDRRAAIRAKLLAALKPPATADRLTAGRTARAELKALLDPFVAERKLSAAAAERVLTLQEECAAHAARSMATCYEPMPVSHVDWESGGGDRDKACKRIGLLDELARTGKLDQAAAAKAKQAIAEGLTSLERLRAYLAETDRNKKAALKKAILSTPFPKPDRVTLQAAGFVLDLFSKP